MRDLFGAVAMTTVLISACAGVGWAFLGFLHVDEPGENGPARRISTGLAACVGLAILLALGGLGLALHLPVFVTGGGFVAVGIALLVWRLAVERGHRPRRAMLLVLAVELALFGCVGVALAGYGYMFNFNPCDDWMAYLPEARRLLDTSALIEPWSNRRLQSFGGQTYLQALYVGVFGNAALSLVEFLFSIAMVWLLITSGLRTPLARILGIAAALLLPFYDVPRANTAGVLSPVPLLVALAMLLLIARDALEQGQHRRAVFGTSALLGIVAVAALSVRTNVAPMAALLVTAGLLTASAPVRDRFRALGVSIGAALVAFVPWGVAMWASSGTPLYPLFPGNANADVPTLTDPSIGGIDDLAERAWDLLSHGPYQLAMIVILIVALVARRVVPRSAVVIVLVAASGLANALLLAASLTIAPEIDFQRYTFPLVATVIVFTLHRCLVRLDEEPVRSFRRPSKLQASVAVTTVLALAAFVWIGTDGPLSYDLKSIKEARFYIHQAKLNYNRDGRLTQPPTVKLYKRALREVPPGAHVIAAVDTPDAFRGTGVDVTSMDAPGWAAPNGDFPFFSGPLNKVRTLRRRGFDVLIATGTGTQACFSRTSLRSNLKSSVTAYRLLAPYVLDFFDDVAALQRRYPNAVQKIHGLYVVDLRKIPGTTPN